MERSSAGRLLPTTRRQRTTTSDNGAQFTVVVSNSAGSATSNAATLTVNTAPVAPTITTQPVSQTVTAGQTATFSVTASGTAPLTYQWSKGGTVISGATASNYTTPGTTISDNGAQFTVVVSNSAGSATSNAATLTVTAAVVAPAITAQPSSVSVVAGQAATFSVAATGTAPLTYQWSKGGTVISGATASNYTTPGTTISDNGAQFTVVVSNSAGSATSNAATLTDTVVAPTITKQPVSQSVTVGQTATFSVTASGTAPLTYQWSKGGTVISGATASNYTTPGTTISDNGAQFTVVVSNSAGSATSNAATLTVNSASQLTASTTNLNLGNVSTGSSESLPVTITNTGGSSVAISKVSISGAGVSTTGISIGQILSAGQGTTLNVTFAPSSTGNLAGSITITSNPALTNLTITLLGVAVAPLPHSATLAWTASTSSISGYNVYRGGVSGGPYTLLNSLLVTTLTYTDSTVRAGQTYYFVVTAVDSTGTESVYSNQTSGTLPTP